MERDALGGEVGRRERIWEPFEGKVYYCVVS